MRLFAIGDLHLSGGEEKPMDVFGPQWDRHFLRISENWKAKVREEDLVLIPGDISWAMQLEQAVPDLQAIGELPGRKIISKGNHEYWWSSLTQLKAVLPEGMTALQYDAADVGPCAVCATRGWNYPTEKAPLAPEDEKIFRRETGRLEMALDRAEQKAPGKPVLVMMHFPPLMAGEEETPFTRILDSRKNVRTVVYGHLHGSAFKSGFVGERNGIRYEAVSCDGIGFDPKEIPWPAL